MFQFSGSTSVHLCVQCTVLGYCPSGFPHSEICGSIPIYGSPQLIAVSHVLLRLLMPRHSPCALISLTISSGSQKELCRSQKFSFLARIVVLPIIPQKICSLRLPAKHPLLPCFFLIFSIVQFSRCNSGLTPDLKIQFLGS